MACEHVCAHSEAPELFAAQKCNLPSKAVAAICASFEHEASLSRLKHIDFIAGMFGRNVGAKCWIRAVQLRRTTDNIGLRHFEAFPSCVAIVGLVTFSDAVINAGSVGVVISRTKA